MDTDPLKSSYLIAVSGGPDSMALATLAFAGLKKIEIVHCNFRLREESDAEEKMVLTYFQSLNIPTHSHTFDTAAYATDQHLTIQQAAREIRYQYFEDLAKSRDLDFILTAHHIEDNSETFLLHLTRGSGLTGLSGIPAKNGNILRPLLSWKKNELLQWLEMNEVPSMLDSSNLKITYDRNYLRHEVLPAYRNRFGALDQAILKSSGIMSEIDAYLQARIKNEWQNALKIYPFGKILYLNQIQDLALSPFIIRKLLQQLNFSHEAINDLLAAINTNKNGVKIESANKTQAIYSRDQICIILKDPANWDLSFIIEPGDIQVFQGKLLIEEIDNQQKPTDKNTIHLPLAMLNKKAYWRKKCPADKIKIKNGHHKIQDLYTNEKLNYFQKEMQPILAVDEEILWIPGLKEAYQKNNDTIQKIKLTYLPNETMKALFTNEANH